MIKNNVKRSEALQEDAENEAQIEKELQQWTHLTCGGTNVTFVPTIVAFFSPDMNAFLPRGKQIGEKQNPGPLKNTHKKIFSAHNAYFFPKIPQKIN